MKNKRVLFSSFPPSIIILETTASFIFEKSIDKSPKKAYDTFVVILTIK